MYCFDHHKAVCTVLVMVTTRPYELYWSAQGCIYCIGHLEAVSSLLVTTRPYVLYCSPQGRTYFIDHHRAVCNVLVNTGPYLLY